MSGEVKERIFIRLQKLIKIAAACLISVVVMRKQTLLSYEYTTGNL